MSQEIELAMRGLQWEKMSWIRNPSQQQLDWQSRVCPTKHLSILDFGFNKITISQKVGERLESVILLPTHVHEESIDSIFCTQDWTLLGKQH